VNLGGSDGGVARRDEGLILEGFYGFQFEAFRSGPGASVWCDGVAMGAGAEAGEKTGEGPSVGQVRPPAPALLDPHHRRDFNASDTLQRNASCRAAAAAPVACHTATASFCGPRMCSLGPPSIPLLLHRYSQYQTGEHANRLGELSPSLVAKLCKSGVCVPYRPF
jgi:hypothetical protein